MGILDRLFGPSPGAGAGEDAGETETVRKIVGRLESLDRDKARYVASFAFVLGRVAHADREFSDEEVRKMESIVHRLGHLSEAESVLVVELAKLQHELFGGTESFVVTREFNEIATREQKLELLDCLFAVSAADESISGIEEAEIRQIASELDFSHREFVAARSAWTNQRDVMKKFRKGGQDA